jgi:hypothetical protein
MKRLIITAVFLLATFPAAADDSTVNNTNLVTQDKVKLGYAVELCVASNWDAVVSCPVGKKPEAAMGACWGDWHEPCLKILQQWRARGYEEQARQAREQQLEDALAFVRDVAKEGGR